MPDTEPRTSDVGLVEIEARLERQSLQRGANGSDHGPAAYCRAAAHGGPTGREDRTDPAAPSLEIGLRRGTVEQLKAKTLPATNLRASSALIIPASAGPTIAPAVTAPTTNRASISYSNLRARAPALFAHDPAEKGYPIFRIMLQSLYPLLTI